MNKTELKRLLIYLAFSFGLAYAWFFVTNMKFVKWQDLSNPMQSFIALGMLAPLLSHILTRLVTKEGFKLSGKDSMMLGISFKNGKWIFFLIAILLPWIYLELSNALTILFFRELYDPEYYVSLEIDKRLLNIFPLAAIVSGVFGSFAAFGEEAGWRGYMMPKLLKLFGADEDTSLSKGKKLRATILACITGGIIWGLWHAPLTCIGHNFGTDYPGFPFVGIARMCLFCTLMGIMLTFVTVKSGSVWPAAIMHAVNNAGPSILNGYINPERASIWITRYFSGIWQMFVMLILAIICLALLLSDKSKIRVKECIEN